MWNSCSAESSPWKMLPPISPHSCSISYGPITCMWRTESLNPGASSSYPSITRVVGADRAAPGPPARAVADERLRELALVELPEERDLRVGGGHDDRRGDLLAGGEEGAAHGAARREDPVDRSLGADLRTEAP